MAAKSDPNLLEVDLARGKMLLAAVLFESAKSALDRFLLRRPEHVEALLTHARALVRLDQNLAAAETYTRAISKLKEPRPELYLERAQALSSMGEEYVDSALRGLNEGVKKLGPIVTLQLYASELETKSYRFDDALARIAQIEANASIKAKWTFRRGEILQKATRHEEARATFLEALNEINSLPPYRQKIKAFSQLKTKLLTVLSREAN